MQTSPHGVQRQSQDLGDLLVAEPLEIAQDDDDASLLGQGGDRLVERGLQLALLQQRGGVGALGRTLEQGDLASPRNSPSARWARKNVSWAISSASARLPSIRSATPKTRC